MFVFERITLREFLSTIVEILSRAPPMEKEACREAFVRPH
jgi:hypothetical protein